MSRSAFRALRSPNDEFQLLEALLTNRRKRHQQGLFLVHGVRAIDCAVASGWPLRTLLVKESARSKWADRLVEKSPAREVVRVADSLLDRLSQREEGAEVVAVAEMRDLDVALMSANEGPVVVAEGIQGPGNLGTIMRSAKALGGGGVVVTGHAADPYDPQTLRASIGALFSVPFAHASSVRTAIEAIPARVVGLDPQGDVIDGVDLSAPLLLVAGTESTGLSRAALDSCDALASIPMTEVTASLNVATAVSIALAEIARRTRELNPK